MLKILRTFVRLVLLYIWILFGFIKVLAYPPLALNLPFLPLYLGPLFALYAAGIYHTEKIWKWMLGGGLMWVIPCNLYWLFILMYDGHYNGIDYVWHIFINGLILSVFAGVSCVALLTKRYHAEKKMMWVGIVLSLCFGWQLAYSIYLWS